jgi:hypothetical protein
MPVVPFSTAPKQQAPKQLSADEEPWALMAAAQMDAEGRLFHPNIDDRRDQGRKETDNRQVEDQQLPGRDIKMDKDVFGILSSAAGAADLDKATKGKVQIGREYDSRGRPK